MVFPYLKDVSRHILNESKLGSKSDGFPVFKLHTASDHKCKFNWGFWMEKWVFHVQTENLDFLRFDGFPVFKRCQNSF